MFVMKLRNEKDNVSCKVLKFVLYRFEDCMARQLMFDNKIENRI